MTLVLKLTVALALTSGCFPAVSHQIVERPEGARHTERELDGSRTYRATVQVRGTDLVVSVTQRARCESAEISQIHRWQVTHAQLGGIPLPDREDDLGVHDGASRSAVGDCQVGPARGVPVELRLDAGVSGPRDQTSADGEVAFSMLDHAEAELPARTRLGAVVVGERHLPFVLAEAEHDGLLAALRADPRSRIAGEQADTAERLRARQVGLLVVALDAGDLAVADELLDQSPGIAGQLHAAPEIARRLRTIVGGPANQLVAAPGDPDAARRMCRARQLVVRMIGAADWAPLAREIAGNLHELTGGDPDAIVALIEGARCE